MATGLVQREEARELEKEILDLARRAFEPIKPLEPLESIADIRPSHFFRLFEIVSGETIPGWRACRNRRQVTSMCQFLINTLEDDVFGLPLDHITGEAIAEGDPRSLKDLLEIFCEITDEFNKRLPLADISISDLHISEKTPDERCQELKIAKDIRADPGFIPPEIRRLLTRINNDAETIAQYSQSCGLMDALQSSQRIKEIFTQTTPIPMTSSVTSPITWDYILKATKLQEAEKLQCKPSLSKPVTRKPIPKAKVSGPITKARGLQRPMGPKKVIKPKPILGSILRRNSSSVVTKANHNSPSKGSPVSLLRLMEHTEKVVSRRREIAREIKKLQNEENFLKTTEAILKKELRFLQQQRPQAPARTLQRLKTRK
ncbi:uncharacterized protein LOC125649344 [Ostrea edulis]|uniref:uncharacterized protein LOC125649344 n=1 Tax=Ostrea edulis TaxID=37623 RepID=UPI00209483A7|nr:uncharacterized protein LOC125649344 [Ostrea edulis]